jgi:dephospho-CoA kinase
MRIIGLTGGIASGKSLVAGIFRSLGANLIDADKIVHELLEPGETAWKEVLDHFGSGIESPDKSIDRKKLGNIVFHNPEERNWLNNCLHPKVFQAYKARVKHIVERQPDAVIVLDAALLIETGYYKQMDKVVVVFATEEQQLKRLMERDGLSPDQALARIRSQMPLNEKCRYADFVIDNTRTREDAQQQARIVFAECSAPEDRD